MQIKILSYNIHKAIGLDQRFRPERIVRILDHHQADIVLLQEVDMGVPRSQRLNLAEEIAAAAGYPHFALGLNVALRVGHYGNATLSRLPIVRQRNIDLTIDSHKRRGALHATLLLEREHEGPVRLEVFNLHLGLSARERSRQLGLLARSPEFTALTPQSPCLVGGDFNDWRTLLAPIFTEILGFACATNEQYGSERPLRTYPSLSPTGSLDKIFCRGPFEVTGGRRCRLNISRIASDHLPVIATLELTGSVAA